MDSPEEDFAGVELTFKPGFDDEGSYTTSQYDGNMAISHAGVTTSHTAPVYLDPTDNVVHSFTWSEHKHEQMRKKYPALEKAYDHYKTLLALAQNGPEDLDN